ncbi:MAG: AbrB/MazE/SpoVT family DNA-binding domain-containing protein [Oscillospiraceae bacterium]|nr:AbrB/MazE/SpoVT family DNA-binding domain-containing protein [Oscillospiraceae bacterium]
MEIAKISSKGQITLPISVRKKLKLKSGDQVVIQEENGRFYFDNAALVAFTRIEQAFDGAAEEAGFANEQAMQDYVEELRKETEGE